MKELSIEEKAKAYDEAIERARVWRNKSGMPTNKIGILDDIFPNLAESEDERMMDIILNDINYAQKNFSVSKLTPYDKKVDWLKSLRPQKQWKPSNEQMNELHKHCIDNMTLDSLYNDLKKL